MSYLRLPCFAFLCVASFFLAPCSAVRAYPTKTSVRASPRPALPTRTGVKACQKKPAAGKSIGSCGRGCSAPSSDILVRWQCHGSHKYPVRAQTGYLDDEGWGYCKPCYRDLYPDAYEEKRQARRRVCRFCLQLKDLIRGICKICARKRRCSTEGCTGFLDIADPLSCRRCADNFALRCPLCTDSHQREAGLCIRCARGIACEYCFVEPSNLPGGAVIELVHCSQSNCLKSVHICPTCSEAYLGGSALCHSCFTARGSKCMSRGQDRAHREHHYQSRCCHCSSAWALTECEYCHLSSSVVPSSFRRCARVGCNRPLRVCQLCVNLHAVPGAVLCHPCYASAGSMCIACGSTRARSERTGRSHCKRCIVSFLSWSSLDDCEG